MDSRWHLYLRTDRPARAIAQQEDWRAAACAHGLSELAQRHREGRDGHGRQQPPHGAPRGWGHKSLEVAPLIAMLDDGVRALAAAAPASPQGRREPDAMLLHRPQLYRVVGVGGLERLDHSRQLFLNATWAIGSAFAWRGRGTFARNPRRRRLAHPRWGGPVWPRVAAIQAATFGPVHRPPSAGGRASAAARAVRCAGAHSPGLPGW